MIIQWICWKLTGDERARIGLREAGCLGLPSIPSSSSSYLHKGTRWRREEMQFYLGQRGLRTRLRLRLRLWTMTAWPNWVSHRDAMRARRL